MRQFFKNISLTTSLLMMCVLFGTNSHCFSQTSLGGWPVSYLSTDLSPDFKPVMLEKPNLVVPDMEDLANDKAGLPYRFAIHVKAALNPANSGQWQRLPDGSRLWQLRVRIPGAKALACYFDDFHLPAGARFFIYTPDHSKTIGAFSAANNQDNRLFATELIPGDEIILEYHEPQGVSETASISLDEVAYAYRGVESITKSGHDFGGSGSCEVNVNCDEGANWTNEKQGVIRIMVKLGTATYWCSGSLLNNVRQDFKPYLLTADHCGQQATAANLSQWIFYFNYESGGCADPLAEPAYTTLVGAEKKASSGYPGTIAGSDFYLVLLKNPVPESFNPYYNGWSRMDNSSGWGVCIHHPQGDIKKISTYTTPTFSATWTSIPNTHWGVKWAPTANGHGVTEGGSSGAPIFGTQHLIMGQLSGGGASCGSPTAPDYFGKFSYSWNPNGSDSTGQLAFWLDPDNTQATFMPALKPNITYVQANFSATRDTIIVGNTVDFKDLSNGDPDQWLWTFKGGDPYQSTAQNPAGIRYNKPGVYHVILTASNSATSDTEQKYYFITVIPNIYPNPFSDKLFIDMGDNTLEDFTVEAYDVLGRPVKMYIAEIDPTHKYSLEPANKTPGLIYLKISSPGQVLQRKVVFVRPSN